MVVHCLLINISFVSCSGNIFFGDLMSLTFFLVFPSWYIIVYLPLNMFSSGVTFASSSIHTSHSLQQYLHLCLHTVIHQFVLNIHFSLWLLFWNLNLFQAFFRKLHLSFYHLLCNNIKLNSHFSPKIFSHLVLFANETTIL